MLLMQGDCLALMPSIPSGSVDLILADLPYGSTDCHWDRVIPPGELWAEYRRLLKPTGVVVLTADFRFAVRMHAAAPRGWFRYDLVWDKVCPVGWLNARTRPLRRHELAMVFSPSGRATYNPIMTQGKPYRVKKRSAACSIYGKQNRPQLATASVDGKRYPTSVLQITNAGERGRLHRTQKPAGLGDWLVRTYSNPGDLVLDNTMGSGTFVASALAAGRRAVGIEADPAIFSLAEARILAAAPPPDQQTEAA